MFVESVRKDPAAMGWQHAKRAGYMGDRGKLSRRAGDLMHKPVVMAAVTQPVRSNEPEIDDETLRREIRHKFRSILKNSRSDSDVLKAGDKLLSTIPGGYVPMQINSKNVLTMETVLRSMGGAPNAAALLPLGDEDD